MKIKLRALGIFEDYLGKKKIIMELPQESTLQQVFKHLNSHWKKIPPSDVWDTESQRIKTPYLFMIDGHDIQDPHYLLADGCDILLIQPLAGG